jgi:protein-disulfide isomerase
MNQTSTLTQQKKTRHALREETLAVSRTRMVTLLVPVAFAMGLLIGYMIWGRSSATLAANDPAGNLSANQAAAQTSQPVTRYKVDDGGNLAVGPNTAPITIVEFSDYQCPYCIKWDTEVYKRLLQAYPDKIRFVYRDFPLYSIHPEAEPAAEAANCAGEQGRYYDYHDKLFSEEVELGSAAYTQYASELGLDMAKFKDCLSSHRYKAEVTSDYEYASNLGVRSTPTFFINGIALIGAQPYENFKQVIDKELSGQSQ